MSVARGRYASFGEARGAMATQLTHNKAFDDYVIKFGWLYDNGGRYRDEHWDWYAGRVTALVLMRQPPSRVAIVQFSGLTPIELWIGQVMTDVDFDRAMATIGCSRVTATATQQ